MSTEKLRKVKFRFPNGGYNTGEIAGFEPEVAARLVERNFAEYYQEEEAPPVLRKPEVKEQEKPKEDSKKQVGRKKLNTRQMESDKGNNYVTK